MCISRIPERRSDGGRRGDGVLDVDNGIGKTEREATTVISRGFSFRVLALDGK